MIQSPLTSKPSALHLPESACTAEESHDSNDAGNRQGLEQVPRAIVEEEDAFHGHNGSEEDAMGQRCSGKGLLKMRNVGSEKNPLDEVSVKFLV
jgi:hypothetical protein